MDNGWQGDQGVRQRGSEGIGGEVGGWEGKQKFAQLSKANGGIWEVLWISIHSPPGHVNRDGPATGRECGPELLGPHCSCVPALHRVGTGRSLSHANELSVTSSTPTPARPRTNTSPK